MENPHSERQADVDPADSPDVDALTLSSDLVRGTRTRDDFFDAVLGLESPAIASEIADRAGHGMDAAREYLRNLVQQDSPIRIRWRFQPPMRHARRTDYPHRRFALFREAGGLILNEKLNGCCTRQDD